MNIQNQKACFWAGASFPIVYGIGWALIAGFFPPHAPDMSAESVAQIFKEQGVAIRLGMFVCLFANALMAAWATAIWAQMKRLEPDGAAVWSTLQLGCGISNVVWFMVPTSLWMTAAFSAQFRPNFPAEGIQALNDTAWILWFVTFAPATIQCWAMGYLGLQDKREKPIFPRKFCYLNFWVGLSLFPAGLISLFVEGPFSWIGVVGLYIPVGIYMLWYFIAAWVLYHAIENEADEIADSAAAQGLAV